MGVRRWLLSITFGVALTGSAGDAAPPEQPNVRVGIALDPAAPVVVRELTTMIAEADAIWRPYGVAVILTPARELDPPEVRLTLSLESSSAYAATVRGPGNRDNEMLGSISFEGGTPGQAVRVNLDAVAARLDHTRLIGLDCRWLPTFGKFVKARALGRVLAHEIGHYLLASPAHSRAGLMRPTFDICGLANPSRQGFKIDRRLLPRLRVRLARLLAPQ